MHKMLLTACLLAFGLAPAFAQTGSATAGTSSSASTSPPAVSGSPGAGGDATSATGNAMTGRGMDGWRMHEAWHHMMRNSGAASFRFRRGDADIDIHCAAREPTQVCVQAALILLDKVASLHGNPQQQ